MDLSLSEDWFAGGDMGWEGSLTAEEFLVDLFEHRPLRILR
jgi:hypothetical protein